MEGNGYFSTTDWNAELILFEIPGNFGHLLSEVLYVWSDECNLTSMAFYVCQLLVVKTY